MGTDRRTPGAGNVAALVILAVVGAPVLYGAFLFLLAVKEDRSPATIAWIAMGLLLFSVGVLAVTALAPLFHAGETSTNAVASVLGLVLVAGGLGASYYWVHVREPALVTTLGAACRGDGVAAAPEPAGARRVVVLDDRGHKLDWTTTDAVWRAEKVAEADLVACVERTEEILETCSYRQLTGVATISFQRVEEVLTVRVVEARTATEVGSFELRGTPRACRKVEEQGQGDLRGRVAFAALAKALAPYRA